MTKYTEVQKYLISEFEGFRALGYKTFSNSELPGYATIVLENAQRPTEALQELVETYLSSDEEVRLVDGGSVVLPDRRVILAMQQLGGKGVDRSGTKQHLLRIASEF